MDKVWDIFGLGALAVDDLIYIDRYPKPDEKLRVKNVQRQGGGLTATALVAAARHGSRAIYCGVLGDDELSLFCLQDFEREGVNCSAVYNAPQASPFHSFILVELTNHSRTILSYSQGVTLPSKEQIREEWIAQSRVVLTDYTAGEQGRYLSQQAHALDVPVVGDFESLDTPNLEEFISSIDHLIVNINFARDFTGKKDVESMVLTLAECKQAACIVTAGSEGCWYSEYGGPVRQYPAFAVQVMDTTGCGDVFHGIYAASLARGETVRRAIEIASASAAIKATHPGGRAGIPDRGTAENFLVDEQRNLGALGTLPAHS